MDLISWRPEYQVGVRLIDTEHKYLFALINEFHAKHARGNALKQCVLVLNRLVAYAEEHFQHEEALMQTINYPRLQDQKGMHKQLYTSIFELNEKLSIEGALVDADTLRFLKHWIIEHIVKEDTRIGDFLRSKAAQSGRSVDEEAGDTSVETSAPKAGATEPKRG